MAPTRPGTAASLDRLTELAYDELRSIAHRHLSVRAGGGSTSIETTALVHEAYLKLAAAAPRAWRDQAHFRACASVTMRHILVDLARARETRKHGGGFTHVTLDDDAIATADDPDTLLAIDGALDELAELSPRLARVVELRFYGGLSESESAIELRVTVRTVQRDWAKARMLLERMLIP
jgi:RNA polymerase sigma factor (TIGR02999 family)